MELRLALMLISDSLLAFAAFSTVVVLRLGLEMLHRSWLEGTALRATLIFMAVSLFSSYLMELYSLARGSSKLEILIKSLQCGCASFFFLSVLYYLDPYPILDHGVLFISIAVFCLYQSTWHIISASAKSSHGFIKKVLILGADGLAKELGELVRAGNMFLLVGYLDYAIEPPEAGFPKRPGLAAEPNVPLRGSLLTTARKENVDVIVVALPERRGAMPLQEMMQCKLNGIEVLDAAAFYEILQGKLMLENITPNWMIFSSGIHRTKLVNFLKRSIDICLSLLGLVICAPFVPLVAIAIKLTSSGPLFTKQIFVGDGEKPILIYGLSCVAAEAEGASDGTLGSDPRAARVVRLLTSIGIGEMPKLYNVLKGDMSLIGPRPERPEFVEMLKKDIYYYSKRHTIKPGLTGWAQVHRPQGSTVKDAVEKLSYDLYYVKNLSVSLDSQIMYETVKVALFGRGSR